MRRQEASGEDRGCPDCASEILHCHFVLIRHVSGEIECPEGSDCAVGFENHEGAISCRQIVPPCGC